MWVRKRPHATVKEPVSRLLDLRSVRSSLLRRGRIPGLRTAKATLAAVLSYVAADLAHTTDQPVLAPLTALLVVQLTLYSTLRHGADRVLSVVAGVLVAVGVATLTGLTWWSLGAVIGLSLVVGRLLRLGPFLLEAPISAMLVLAAAGLGPATPLSDAGAHLAATGRVVETLIGALVGVVVNLVVAPPLYLQPATDAVDELTARISGFSRELAAALRGEWARADAARFLEGSRRLGTEVARTDRHLDRTEESARLNPRGRAAREAQPRLRVTLTGLEHCYLSLRNLCRAVQDRTFTATGPVAAGGEAAGTGGETAGAAGAGGAGAGANWAEGIGWTGGTAEAYSPEARKALAEVLDAFAGTIDTVSTRPERSSHEPRDDFAELLACRDELAALLLVDPRTDPIAWEQHGALLAAVDRLRVEVAATARPIEAPAVRSRLTNGRRPPAARPGRQGSAPGSGGTQPRGPSAVRGRRAASRCPSGSR